MAIASESRLIELLPCAHRCLHRDLQGRAKAKTLARYSKVYNDFSVLSVEAGDFSDSTVATEMDRLVCQYREAERLSKTLHIHLLSAIELYVPELKGQLKRTKEALRGRSMNQRTNHTQSRAPICSTGRIREQTAHSSRHDSTSAAGIPCR